MSPSPPDEGRWPIATVAEAAQAMATLNQAVSSAQQSLARLAALLACDTSRYAGGLPPMAIYTPEHFSAEAQDLKVGSLYGVRYWNVTGPWHDDGARLFGAMHYAWAPGENVAVCANEKAVAEHTFGLCGDGLHRVFLRAHTFDEIPSRACGCGFWAYWSPDAAFGNIASPGVVGVVEGWGGYRTGSKGFRCSRARVVALAVVPGEESWRTALEAALADSYRVPIFSRVETMLKRFPPSRSAPLAPPPAPPGVNDPHGLIARAMASWRAQTAVTLTGGLTQPRVLCMACHANAADTWTIRAEAVAHCGTCSPPRAPCQCPAHCAPAQPTVPAHPVTPIDALGILDAKRCPPQ